MPQISHIAAVYFAVVFRILYIRACSMAKIGGTEGELGDNMLSIIETPNLGLVKISPSVIEHFRKQREDDDIAKSIEEAVQILQSLEIEKLDILPTVALKMSLNGNDHNALEFWLHRGSSMAFLIIPQDNYKLVSGAIMQNMENFIFDDH
jgi:hypothetical protein